MLRRPLIAPTKRAVLLRPVRPNLSLELRYRDAIMAPLKRMHDDLMVEILRVYAEHPPLLTHDATPTLAADAGPADFLASALAGLRHRWGEFFNSTAENIAPEFARKMTAAGDAGFRQSLRDGGFTVRLQMTPQTDEVLANAVADNVNLIKSIGQQHLAEVEAMVLRSARAGGTVGPLKQDLIDRFDISANRASLIARDQNSKATSVITRARQTEFGITRARWLHSAGGRYPRPEHVSFSAGRHEGPNPGPFYDVRQGAYLEDRWTWPGFEINCRCVSVAVVPGVDTAG